MELGTDHGRETGLYGSAKEMNRIPGATRMAWVLPRTLDERNSLLSVLGEKSEIYVRTKNAHAT